MIRSIISLIFGKSPTREKLGAILFIVGARLCKASYKIGGPTFEQAVGAQMAASIADSFKPLMAKPGDTIQ